MSKNQHIGTCPVCFSTHSCNDEGRLAQHGWREGGNRRKGSYGNAWHTGSCSGSGMRAFELGAVATWDAVARAQHQLERIITNPLLEEELPPVLGRHMPDYKELSEKSKKQRQLRLHRRAVCDYIQMATQRALAWEPQELTDRRVIERQEAEKKRAEREAEAAERKAKRDEKAARKAARESAKADSLVKLEELFQSADPGVAYSLGQLKKLTGASNGTVSDFVHQVVMASKEPSNPVPIYVDWERKNEEDPRWTGMMNRPVYKTTGKLLRIEPVPFDRWSGCEWRPDADGTMELLPR